MAITPAWYGQGLLSIVKNDVDLETATVKLALLSSSYTPDRDADNFFDDVSAYELSAGSGYSAGGVTLASVAYSYDSASDQVRLDFTDPTFSFSGSKTWRYGVVYVDTAGAASTDPLIGLLDFGSDQTVSTSYTLILDSAGLLYIDCT